MDRPPLEVADLVRAAGDAFIERSRKWITWKHVKVLLAIARCRTAMLGGHLDECTRCGHRAISYNSCRNRHCPKCQAGARDRWLAARRQELLPTPYVHVVFTLPRHLAPLVLQNKKVIYDLLFRTSAETLLEVARDPQHLGAEIAPSLTTRVEIGTARSVRQGLAIAGSQRVARNFSRRPMSMWSSRFLVIWLRWFCRTRRSSTTSCFAPVQKPFWKSPAIPNI